MEYVTGNIHGVIPFDDVANQLMGISSKDLCLLSIEAASIVEIVYKIRNKQLLLTLSVRTETYGISCLKFVIFMVENT